MQKISRTIFATIGAAASLAAVPAVSEAQAPAAPAYAAPGPVFFFGQPYMRMDVGGAFSLDQHYHDADPTSANAPLAAGDGINGGVSPTGVIDLGLGARLNPYVRWDATLSYMPGMNFNGGEAFAPGTTAHADIDSLVGMVNGYLDLAPFGISLAGFQPYLDAGIGAASNHLDSMNTNSGLGVISGNTHTSLAWGAGAGLAMPLSPLATLDFSYKYLDLGDVESGTTDAAGAITPIKAGLRTNVVLAGLRLGF